MAWDVTPVSLLKILTFVPSLWVIGFMVLDSKWPMIGGPDNLYAGQPSGLCETTGTGEQVNCFHSERHSPKEKYVLIIAFI